MQNLVVSHSFELNQAKLDSSMLTETVLEILRFFCRHELEALQIYSRYLRDLINRYAGDLPLRHISHVSVSKEKS